ncbi:uncharacterized protein LOC143784580 [Ranitomeya variabilis]|uniref:uncharacterized protein LOC143784580 n=1 Tax=Ranitomeya variabilis TaxID=490064 RepID=UPI0040573DF3
MTSCNHESMPPPPCILSQGFAQLLGVECNGIYSSSDSSECNEGCDHQYWQKSSQTVVPPCVEQPWLQGPHRMCFSPHPKCYPTYQLYCSKLLQSTSKVPSGVPSSAVPRCFSPHPRCHPSYPALLFQGASVHIRGAILHTLLCCSKVLQSTTKVLSYIHSSTVPRCLSPHPRCHPVYPALLFQGASVHIQSANLRTQLCCSKVLQSIFKVSSCIPSSAVPRCFSPHPKCQPAYPALLFQGASVHIQSANLRTQLCCSKVLQSTSKVPTCVPSSAVSRCFSPHQRCYPTYPALLFQGASVRIQSVILHTQLCCSS